jgi:hypothetical protein
MIERYIQISEHDYERITTWCHDSLELTSDQGDELKTLIQMIATILEIDMTKEEDR